MLYTDLQCSFAEKGYPVNAELLAKHPRVDWPSFPRELDRFIYERRHPNTPFDSDTDTDIPAHDLGRPNSRIHVYHSATAVFHAPSDLCGVGGMRKEVIRATPRWRNGPPRYDCVFVETNAEAVGFRALDVARIWLFFSLKDAGEEIPCALVHWFEKVGAQPHEDTGMWVVKPGFVQHGRGGRKPKLAIISIDSILRAAHLIPVYGNGFIPSDKSFTETLDIYERFFVNKFVDHHAYEVAF